MTESRLQRWARKKAETRQDAQSAPPAPASPSASTPEPPLAPNPADQALAENEQLTEQELLAKYNLPNPDALEQGTDITGFLRKEIPEFLRRKALRSLWRSNPVFSVLDGLNEYDEDFSKAKTFPGGVKTAYKVGQGFLDKEKRERERLEAAEESPTDDVVRLTEGADQATAAQKAQRETDAAERSFEPSDREPSEREWQGSAHFEQSEYNQVADVDEDAPPRYRPRMQFDVE